MNNCEKLVNIAAELCGKNWKKNESDLISFFQKTDLPTQVLVCIFKKIPLEILIEKYFEKNYWKGFECEEVIASAWNEICQTCIEKSVAYKKKCRYKAFESNERKNLIRVKILLNLLFHELLEYSLYELPFYTKKFKGKPRFMYREILQRHWSLNDKEFMEFLSKYISCFHLKGKFMDILLLNEKIFGITKTNSLEKVIIFYQESTPLDKFYRVLEKLVRCNSVKSVEVVNDCRKSSLMDIIKICQGKILSTYHQIYPVNSNYEMSIWDEASVCGISNNLEFCEDEKYTDNSTDSIYDMISTKSFNEDAVNVTEFLCPIKGHTKNLNNFFGTWYKLKLLTLNAGNTLCEDNFLSDLFAKSKQSQLTELQLVEARFTVSSILAFTNGDLNYLSNSEVFHLSVCDCAIIAGDFDMTYGTSGSYGCYHNQRTLTIKCTFLFNLIMWKYVISSFYPETLHIISSIDSNLPDADGTYETISLMIKYYLEIEKTHDSNNLKHLKIFVENDNLLVQFINRLQNIFCGFKRKLESLTIIVVKESGFLKTFTVKLDNFVNNFILEKSYEEHIRYF